MMKFISLFLVVIAAQAAHADLPNDTQTGIVAKSGDCSQIDATDAYYTLFGDGGGAGVALVFQVNIRNLAYDKVVEVRHANGQSSVATQSPNPAPVKIRYESQSGGIDRATIVDRMVGIDRRDQIALSVTMNGQTSTCQVSIAPR